ncbi:MAG: hypothetical protein GWP91_05065 [Rhodobacterales bacterium]|nr:hypothetical protein [Rhodobacterales bacterium]
MWSSTRPGDAPRPRSRYLTTSHTRACTIESHPPLEHWFAAGGDHRLIENPQTGLTPYRASLRPRNTAQFGSCTASSPGPRGWAAGQHALKHCQASDEGIRETAEQTRMELRNVMEIPAEIAVAMAPSGTDILYLVSHIALQGVDSVHHVVVGANELGGGTLKACRGLTFSAMTPFGGDDEVGRPIAGLAERCTAEAIYLREAAGQRLDTDAVDAQVEQRVDELVTDGKRIILHMVVHSKTGLRAPSALVAARLRQRHGDKLMVLVDAAQGRLAPSDIRRALKLGFVVMFTGSKFYSGPPFSGVLFLPTHLSADPGPLVPELSKWFDQASLPGSWVSARESLSEKHNQGLALRWTAAMAEFNAYHAILPRWRGRVYATFAGAIHETFGPPDIIDLEIPLPPVHQLVTALGAFPTVFGFRVRGPDGWFDAPQLKSLHAMLDTDLSHEDPRWGGVYHLGQPVALGPPDGERRAFLRVALGARLITDFGRTPNAGGPWMREQMSGIRTKVETLVRTGRMQP